MQSIRMSKKHIRCLQEARASQLEAKASLLEATEELGAVATTAYFDSKMTMRQIAKVVGVSHSTIIRLIEKELNGTASAKIERDYQQVIEFYEKADRSVSRETSPTEPEEATNNE